MVRIKFLPAFLSVLAITSALNATQITQNAEVQGFTQESIMAMNTALHSWVDSGRNGANMVTLLARNGEIVSHDAYGSFTAANKSDKVQKDSIYNIMSMTKPVSGVLMMTFYEEGKFTPDDLVSKHIPEFGNLLVNGQPQRTPMTMAQLMSHSAGFGANMIATGATLKAGVEALGRGSLAFQPGDDWRYGPGVEIQGYLMEKWAGKDFADIMAERLLKPLGMTDTNFWVPAEKRDRVVPSALAPPRSKPTRIIPSYGLYATAMDYWKVCQMVLNGGTFEGKRYLKPETIKLMQTNVLQMDKGVYVNFIGGGKGVGFGLDFAVLQDPAPTNNQMPKGSFFWGGAFGTWFWIDPTYNVTFIGLVNTMGGGLSGDPTLRQASARHIYTQLRKSIGQQGA